MLERQRNAEVEKSKLLESEVKELRSAYQQVYLLFEDYKCYLFVLLDCE